MCDKLVEIKSTIQSVANGFQDVLSGDLDFKREAFFALQVMDGNNYTAGIARSNPRSLQFALKNVATIGLSLNPSLGLCYLVPRKNAIHADISYKGLCKLATDTGAILWLQARIVFEKDTFRLNGIDEKPTHEVENEFMPRGEMAGAYCVAKTKEGDYLTKVMTADQIRSIRDRSEAYKAYQKKGSLCPWVSDTEEMWLKTVVRNASKMLPRSSKLDKAFEILDQHDDFDFKAPVLISEDDAATISLLCEEITGGFERLQKYVKTAYRREIGSIEEIRANESEALIKLMKNIATKEVDDE